MFWSRKYRTNILLLLKFEPFSFCHSHDLLLQIIAYSINLNLHLFLLLTSINIFWLVCHKFKSIWLKQSHTYFVKSLNCFELLKLWLLITDFGLGGTSVNGGRSGLERIVHGMFWRLVMSGVWLERNEVCRLLVYSWAY